MNTETNFCLRIDVDTFEGIKLGIPEVVDFVLKQECPATIYLSMGKFATGRNIFRIIRNKEIAKKRIPPWIRNHPKSIIRGLLLPPRRIKEKERKKLRDFSAEPSIEFHPHGYNHIKWSRNFSNLSYEKTKGYIDSFIEEYSEIFSKKPIANAAPNFQVNKHYFQLLRKKKFSFTSDLYHSIPFKLQFKRGDKQSQAFQLTQLPVTEKSIEDFILQGKTSDQILEEYKNRFEEYIDSGKNYICLYAHAIFEPMRFRNLLTDILKLVYKLDMKITTHSDFANKHKELSIIPYEQLYGGIKP